MQKPLTHQPLCVLDPNTVPVSDCVHINAYAPNLNAPSSSMALKYNKNHRWYFYPNMTKDEVLVFSQIDIMKGVDNTLPNARVTCNFHTSFVDPTAPAQDEPRKSCEHRVQVFFKLKGTGKFMGKGGRFSMIKKFFKQTLKPNQLPTQSILTNEQVQKQNEINNRI